MAKVNKLKIGQKLGGGFYVGDISGGGIDCRLIVAPKADGEAIKKWMECLSGAESCTDGLNNTENILKTIVTFPAAQFCADLRIGGFDDWYLPSKNELAVAWKANKILAGISEAFADNYFWSSSEYSAPYAWYQAFYSGSPGYQYFDTKTSGNYVRAFRRLII